MYVEFVLNARGGRAFVLFCSNKYIFYPKNVRQKIQVINLNSTYELLNIGDNVRRNIPTIKLKGYFFSFDVFDFGASHIDWLTNKMIERGVPQITRPIQTDPPNKSCFDLRILENLSCTKCKKYVISGKDNQRTFNYQQHWLEKWENIIARHMWSNTIE